MTTQSSEFRIIVGVCREDNRRDVDEAYGEGTYERLFPPQTYKTDADRLFPAGCTCPDDGGCDWCSVYYDGPPDDRREDPAKSHGRP